MLERLMRPALGGLIALAAFVGVLLIGGKAFGVWEPLPRNNEAIAQAPRAHSTGYKAPNPTQASTGNSVETKGRERAAPKERLRHTDVTIARKAVLHQADMNGPGWLRIRPSSEQPPRCASYNPDLSRFTVTGKAQSIFKGGISYIDSRAALLANAIEAQRYFEARFNPRSLPCVRDAIKRGLAVGGRQVRALAANYSPAANVGEQTATYVFQYLIAFRGKRFSYPVEVIAFRTSRAVGSLWFAAVPSTDGQRPCACEYYEARKVEGRLSGT
jgi:hypothetical protein